MRSGVFSSRRPVVDASACPDAGRQALARPPQAAFAPKTERQDQPVPVSHSRPLIVKKDSTVAATSAAAQTPSLPYFWPSRG